MRFGSTIFRAQALKVISSVPFVSLPVCPKVLDFEIRRTRFVAIDALPVFVVVVQTDVEAHSSAASELVVDSRVLEHSLLEPHFHRPASRDSFARTKNITVLA